MPHEITIPRLGWSMEEGVFSEWLKAPGEMIHAGDMLFLLEGEKAAMEIEAVESGLLCIPVDGPEPGSVVKVGAVIGFLLSEGEPVPTSVHGAARELAGGTTNQSLTSKNAPVSRDSLPVSVAHSGTASHIHPLPTAAERPAGPAARRLARELGVDLNTVASPDPTGRVLVEDVRRLANRSATGSESRAASTRHVAQNPTRDSANYHDHRVVATPRARRRAQEMGVAWTDFAGSGRNGRIRERDILANCKLSRNTDEPTLPLIPPTAPGQHAQASKIRRMIAERMSAGVHQAAPVTLTHKADAATLVAFRQHLKATNVGGDSVSSYNDILVQLIAETLRELPELNACWFRDGIHTYSVVNLAIAMDTPNGLLAPVVHNADQLSLAEITQRTRRLIARAQAGQLTQNELTGATFTISNLGMFGIDAFTPILNLPQAAILGVGRIVQEPVIRDGRIEIGETIMLSLTFDHRVIDGAPAARWLQLLCEKIKKLELFRS